MDNTSDIFTKCPHEGMPPIHGESVKILILGSFPGTHSLMKNEYYGNERNQFWQIIEILLHIDRHIPYEVRTAELARRGIALWDVIHSCCRQGSADTRIRDSGFQRYCRVPEILSVAPSRSPEWQYCGPVLSPAEYSGTCSSCNTAVNKPGKRPAYPE